MVQNIRFYGSVGSPEQVRCKYFKSNVKILTIGCSGKSVMSSYIIQELLKTPKVNICYYFCNSQDPENVCAQILRTFALQFLRSNNDLASLICNQFVYQGMNCGLKELKVLITQLLELSSCTRIIIDGIDECSKENQVSVLKHMQSLFFEATSHCKILFSSRKEAHIAEKLSKKPQICLDDRFEVDSDIRLFVRSNVGSLRTSDTALSNKIGTILVDKANGLFPAASGNCLLTFKGCSCG
jgi:hypothetical protein